MKKSKKYINNKLLVALSVMCNVADSNDIDEHQKNLIQRLLGLWIDEDLIRELDKVTDDDYNDLVNEFNEYHKSYFVIEKVEEEVLTKDMN